MATPTYLWHSGEVMVYLQPKQQFLNVVAKEREMTSGTNKHFFKNAWLHKEWFSLAQLHTSNTASVKKHYWEKANDKNTDSACPQQSKSETFLHKHITTLQFLELGDQAAMRGSL